MSDETNNVSRREFLKIAGITGATIGTGAGLGGLIAACGEEEATTTTAGAATTASVTTTAGATTTASVEAEMGREIKVGYVFPETGVLAAFGIPDKYCLERATEAIGEGIVCGDGQKHPVTFVARDGQSDSNRGAQVAADLINNDKVDLMLCDSTADTVLPVADQCEAAGVPCLSTDLPWQNFVFARGKDPSYQFQWTYNFFWGVEDLLASFISAWEKLPTNKKVSVLLSNDALGQAFVQPLELGLPAAGYAMDLGDLYTPGLEDWSAYISQFKKNGDEITLSFLNPGDLSNFWKQCLQQGYQPKIGTFGMSITFPEAATSLGDLCINMTCESMFNRAFPFTSSLLNESCAQFSDEYEKRQGAQSTPPLQHFSVFEWGVDVMKRTKNVDDPQSYIDAVLETKMTTVAGPIDFTAAVDPAMPIGPARVTPNCYKSVLTAVQWRKGTGKWPYEAVIVSNAAAPMIPTESEPQPLTYG